MRRITYVSGPLSTLMAGAETGDTIELRALSDKTAYASGECGVVLREESGVIAFLQDDGSLLPVPGAASASADWNVLADGRPTWVCDGELHVAGMTKTITLPAGIDGDTWYTLKTAVLLRGLDGSFTFLGLDGTSVSLGTLDYDLFDGAYDGDAIIIEHDKRFLRIFPDGRIEEMDVECPKVFDGWLAHWSGIIFYEEQGVVHLADGEIVYTHGRVGDILAHPFGVVWNRADGVLMLTVIRHC